jgi:histidinol phosphatase-like PHP family hydrolase
MDTIGTREGRSWLFMANLDNAAIAELLSQKAEEASYPVKRALRRAGRAAFLWREEAGTVLEQGRSLTELPAIGPYLEKLIRGWLEKPPVIAELPEIRSGFLTLPKARQALASHDGWLTDLKGDLQMHTEWSDGSGSIQQMAEAAEERGYEYIAITDHSKGLKIAGGINEDELAQQTDEINVLNQSLPLRNGRVQVLRSIELNINPHGEGDMDPSSLSRLDIVLGCFHSALRRTDDQTDRYLAALRNPNIQILGHPRGRIYNYRLGLSADWPRVFDTAAELDKAVEIDAYPDRQDLSLDLVRLARNAGCRISIGTDSHHPWQLEFIELGLAAACLAGVRREQILNYMPREELLKWVSRVRNYANSDAQVQTRTKRSIRPLKTFLQSSRANSKKGAGRDNADSRHPTAIE